MKSNKIPRLAYLILTFGILAITGCSGGGSGTGTAVSTVSGVAAAGAPLIGQVSLVSAKGALAPDSPKTINVDGSFSFDVSGLTPPFLLKAEGAVGEGSITLYSVAMGAGTANINPMTNVAVAAAAGVNDPASVFDNAVGNASLITSATLSRAISDMQVMMAPLLTAFNATGINPVTGSYAADHTRLDALFDAVQMPIDTATGTVTFFDKTTGASGTAIGSALMSQMATPLQPITQIPSTSVAADLRDIAKMLSSMVPVLNKGAGLTNADLTPFFVPDPAFGTNGGLSGSQTMDLLRTLMAKSLANKTVSQVSNVTFDGNAPVGGYRISFAIHFSDGSVTMSNMTFSDEMVVAKNASGVWQFKGDGHLSSIFNKMLTQQWHTMNGSQIESGIDFVMSDSGMNLKSAVVTGPGLPSPGGVTLVKGTADPSAFMLATPNSSLPSMATEFFTISDADIAQIPDNAPFTFSFYSSLPPRNNPVEQRTMTFPKRCFTRTEAAGAIDLFTTVTPTANGLTAHTHSFSTMMSILTNSMTGGTLSMPFTYTTPTGLPVVMLAASFSIASSTFNNSVDQILPLNATPVAMQMQGPTGTVPTSGTGELKVQAVDLFGRAVATDLMFQ